MDAAQLAINTAGLSWEALTPLCQTSLADLLAEVEIAFRPPAEREWLPNLAKGGSNLPAWGNWLMNREGDVWRDDVAGTGAVARAVASCA